MTNCLSTLWFITNAQYVCACWCVQLLDLQLSDSNFRRCILLQYLILFHYLNAQVRFKTLVPLICFMLVSEVTAVYSPAHVVQWSNHLGAMCSRA